MGQYKDPPLSDRIAPGGLTTALPPGPGTRWFNGRIVVQGTAYAPSKLMGERGPRDQPLEGLPSLRDGAGSDPGGRADWRKVHASAGEPVPSVDA
jgi:hypothetical protein